MEDKGTGQCRAPSVAVLLGTQRTRKVVWLEQSKPRGGGHSTGFYSEVGAMALWSEEGEGLSYICQEPLWLPPWAEQTV